MKLRKDNKNFWQDLKRPLFVMAPLANVTDAAFRRIIAKYGKPDVMWTEFVSADGLCSSGKDKLLIDLKYSSGERPIVAQLFTGHPEVMKKAAALVKKLKFDGLDINMGCPDRAVERQGGGAALIKNPSAAIKVIESAREGSGLPVSVKTRIGYNRVDLGWIETLLKLKLPALTVHLRTRKEMSDVPAHWELMPEIVRLRDQISPETLIIGNGDVLSIDHGKKLIKESGCDGVMIGRGIFGTPWLFDTKAKNKTPEERLKVLVEHALLFDKTFRGIKNFAVMCKHFKAYVSGWDGAKDLRVRLMEAENAKEVKKIVGDYLK